jgi:hypothetical protein
MGLMMSATELAQLRTDILITLVGTAIILRATTSTAGTAFGIHDQTWGTAAAGVPCRIDPYNKMDSRGMVADRESLANAYRLTVKWDADLRDGDRVVVLSDTYELVQIHDDHDYRAVRRAVVSKIQGA